MSDWDWTRKIFDYDELVEMGDKGARIISDNDNGFVITITLSNAQCMDFVHHYNITQDSGLIEDDDNEALASYVFLDDFMGNLSYFLDNYLTEHLGDWEERRHGIAE